jgi:hypothetical protein
MQLLALLFSVALAQDSTSNTNQVLSILPSLAASCPHNLPKCCSVLVEFSKAGGFCSPLAKSLLGNKYGLLKNVVRNGCRLIKPFQFPHVFCGEFESHTYNGGSCSKSDVELEADRFLGAIQFSKGVIDMGKKSGCFDFPAFKGFLASKMVEEPIIMAAHGLGTYKGRS